MSNFIPGTPEGIADSDPYQATSSQPSTLPQVVDLTDEPTPTLPQLPQKRTHDAMLCHQYNDVEPPPRGWDGSPPTPWQLNHSMHFAKAAAAALQQGGHDVLVSDIAANMDDSDAESEIDVNHDSTTFATSTMASTPGAPQPLTRKEAKALDREIPWRQILKMGKKDLEQFIISARKEEDGWKKWDSVEALNEHEAKRILSCPQGRRRVLRSRACYRNKSRLPGVLHAKTRVVALGHLDPDLEKITRDSPTPCRVSEYLIYCIYAAGVNGLFQNTGRRWMLWGGDVSTAFLQGDYDYNERGEALYLLPPQDHITRMAGTFTAPLYRVKSNIYGLASAPRTWYKEVVRRCRQANYVQHSLDHLVFYRFIRGKLVSVCMVYVDDFLMTCEVGYDRNELLSKFTWGAQTELSSTSPLDFKGKELSLHKAGNAYHLHVTLSKFTSTTATRTTLRRSSTDGTRTR